MRRIEKHVIIVGPRRLQSELLAAYIGERTGITCTTAATMDEARDAYLQMSPDHCLFLRECPATSAHAVRQQLLATPFSAPGTVLAMFNVPSGEDIERDTIPLGVRGFFYSTEGPKVLLKGIPALFAGELWLSRKAMSDCLVNARTVRPAGTEEEPLPLTRREMEVLASIAAGATNDVIADRLCISPHTVKTHIYRIFRKVGASNRLEAALWAAKNV